MKLVLLRHGQSEWNLENKFTGWTDVDLTKKGEAEAKNAGQLIKNEKIKIDLVFTSVLKRAINTMNICLSNMDDNNPGIFQDWRLNERHYGSLQGLNKCMHLKEEECNELDIFTLHQLFQSRIQYEPVKRNPHVVRTH